MPLKSINQSILFISLLVILRLVPSFLIVRDTTITHHHACMRWSVYILKSKSISSSLQLSVMEDYHNASTALNSDNSEIYIFIDLWRYTVFISVSFSSVELTKLLSRTVVRA